MVCRKNQRISPLPEYQSGEGVAHCCLVMHVPLWPESLRVLMTNRIVANGPGGMSDFRKCAMAWRLSRCIVHIPCVQVQTGPLGDSIATVLEVTRGYMRVAQRNWRPPTPQFLHQTPYIWYLFYIREDGQAIFDDTVCMR